MVVVVIPAPHAVRHRPRSWSGAVMPTFASPSVSRTTRLTPPSRLPRATSSRPRSQPPLRFVEPPGWIALHLLRQRRLRVAGRRLGDRGHFVVVGDDADGVVRVQPLDEHRGRIAGGGELLAGHGAGAVEDDGEVEGDAIVARGCFAFQLEQGAHDEALLRDGELVVDEDLVLHGAPPSGRSHGNGGV